MFSINAENSARFVLKYVQIILRKRHKKLRCVSLLDFLFYYLFLGVFASFFLDQKTLRCDFLNVKKITAKCIPGPIS